MAKLGTGAQSQRPALITPEQTSQGGSSDLVGGRSPRKGRELDSGVSEVQKHGLLRDGCDTGSAEHLKPLSFPPVHRS